MRRFKRISEMCNANWRWCPGVALYFISLRRRESLNYRMQIRQIVSERWQMSRSILTEVDEKPAITLTLVRRKGENTRDVVVQKRILLLQQKDIYYFYQQNKKQFSIYFFLF